MNFLPEFWQFLKIRKKYWLLPIIIILVIFGGLIAEEVHDAGLTEFVEYDKDNKPDALQYSNMLSLCIKAIQELEARIKTLESS